MAKIKVVRSGIIHYHAMCFGCSWSDDGYKDRVGLRNRVRKHVRETGHSVTIESGSATMYELEK